MPLSFCSLGDPKESEGKKICRLSFIIERRRLLINSFNLLLTGGATQFSRRYSSPDFTAQATGLIVELSSGPIRMISVAGTAHIHLQL